MTDPEVVWRFLGTRRLQRSGHLHPSLLSGRFKNCSGAVEGFGQQAELSLGTRRIRSADGLVDTRNDHGSVAGELARRVDGVLVPGAVRKTIGIQQSALGCAQRTVELSRVS